MRNTHRSNLTGRATIWGQTPLDGQGGAPLCMPQCFTLFAGDPAEQVKPILDCGNIVLCTTCNGKSEEQSIPFFNIESTVAPPGGRGCAVKLYCCAEPEAQVTHVHCKEPGCEDGKNLCIGIRNILCDAADFDMRDAHVIDFNVETPCPCPWTCVEKVSKMVERINGDERSPATASVGNDVDGEPTVLVLTEKEPGNGGFEVVSMEGFSEAEEVCPSVMSFGHAKELQFMGFDPECLPGECDPDTCFDIFLIPVRGYHVAANFGSEPSRHGSSMNSRVVSFYYHAIAIQRDAEGVVDGPWAALKQCLCDILMGKEDADKYLSRLASCDCAEATNAPKSVQWCAFAETDGSTEIEDDKALIVTGLGGVGEVADCYEKDGVRFFTITTPTKTAPTVDAAYTLSEGACGGEDEANAAAAAEEEEETP